LVENSVRLKLGWGFEKINNDNCLGNIDLRRTQHMDLWMEKWDKNGFPNMNTVIKGGFMLKSDLLPLTQVQIHISFPIPPHHFWRVLLYFYAILRRITYDCNVSSSFR
jgi:hypothetical protein